MKHFTPDLSQVAEKKALSKKLVESPFDDLPYKIWWFNNTRIPPRLHSKTNEFWLSFKKKPDFSWLQKTLGSFFSCKVHLFNLESSILNWSIGYIVVLERSLSWAEIKLCVDSALKELVE